MLAVCEGAKKSDLLSSGANSPALQVLPEASGGMVPITTRCSRGQSSNTETLDTSRHQGFSSTDSSQARPPLMHSSLRNSPMCLSFPTLLCTRQTTGVFRRAASKCIWPEAASRRTDCGARRGIVLAQSFIVGDAATSHPFYPHLDTFSPQCFSRTAPPHTPRPPLTHAPGAFAPDPPPAAARVHLDNPLTDLRPPRHHALDSLAFLNQHGVRLLPELFLVLLHIAPARSLRQSLPATLLRNSSAPAPTLHR